MKQNIKTIGLIFLWIFALIGVVFSAVFIAMQFGLFNVPGSIKERNQFFNTNTTTSPTPHETPCTDKTKTVCEWNETPEWEAVKGGLQKDAIVITKVANETGVSPRMIASVVIPEQIRFFTSDREVFKRYFEPLKILGSLSQFSLGVSGIKQETANTIETNANDPASPFYPGQGMNTLLQYPAGADHDKELFNRLTDPKNHYYSYLYTALYIKEIEAQWQKAGFDISKNPEAVVTLFNIGFQGSRPNANPQTAGAQITVGGKTYVFGELGGLFYRSNELSDIFSN